MECVVCKVGKPGSVARGVCVGTERSEKGVCNSEQEYSNEYIG